MDSESIRKVVFQATRLKATGDRNLHTDEAKNIASTLLLDMIRTFRKSPTFAAAIVQHLSDEGFDLSRLRGSAYIEFSREFGGRIGKLNDAQVASLRAISQNLFNQSKKVA